MTRYLFLAACVFGLLLVVALVRSHIAKDACDDGGGFWQDGECLYHDVTNGV